MACSVILVVGGAYSHFWCSLYVIFLPLKLQNIFDIDLQNWNQVVDNELREACFWKQCACICTWLDIHQIQICHTRLVIQLTLEFSDHPSLVLICLYSHIYCNIMLYQRVSNAKSGILCPYSPGTMRGMYVHS